MFRRFRHPQKASQATGTGHQCPSIATAPIKKTTFFDLPAELRNEIYELAANNSSLRVAAKSSKTKQQDEAIPSMLIASRQCRAEYLPILLATSPVEMHVQNFDFSNVMRITGSLYSTELKALRANVRLTLRLTFPQSNVARGGGGGAHSLESSLRTWITRRSAGMDRLPWHYALPIRDRTPRVSGHTAFMIGYQKCMSTLRMLHAKVDEALQWELHIMMNELEAQGAVSGEYWRNRYAEYQVAKVRGWI